MLKRVRLKNFKCFDELSLPLAPLTLLTGFNAAGKSTALQSILLLAQALRSGYRKETISLNGPLVQLGTPAETLNERASSKTVELGVETDEANMHWVLDVEDRTSTSLKISKITVETRNGTVDIDACRSLDQAMSAGNRVDAATDIISALRETVFLSAVRFGAADVFPSPEDPGLTHADVGVQGEYAPWWFYRFLDEEIDAPRHHADEPGHTLRRQFNAWASDLFPGAEANVQRVTRTNLVRLELRIGNTDDWRRPANIGYGLTYAFPILVGCLLAKRDQVVIVDSPEAHLHPLGQSRMGQFLAKMAAAGVQIAIETHSDHVLNGIRLALHSGIIAPEKVAIHFFKNRSMAESEATGQVFSPVVDKTGNLSDWPNGFFDQSEKDLARLAGWG